MRLRRGSKLRDSKERPEFLSIKKNKKDLKPRDKLKSRLKELNMKRELKWKDLSVRRDWKSTGLIKRELGLREKLNSKP